MMDATLHDPLVGQLLDGRYRVDARIARGGMSTVYRGIDIRLDRTVALKVMHPGLAADEGFVGRFIREAKSAARLSHPNVVSVFDQGTDNGSVFLAMEFIDGRTLRDLLRERGRLPVAEALDIVEPVLAALDAAHRAGIVHRDVKPENVLLSSDGRVKVADFGLARAATGASTSSSTSGMLIGTVAYLAPEQVVQGAADARTDVYATGVLLFELLTGSKPYDGDSPLQVAYRHVHEDVPAPSSRVSGVPPAVDELVRRATSRDPDARPADAGALLDEVLDLRRTLPTPSHAPAGAPLGDTLVVPLPDEPPAMTGADPGKPAGATPARAPRRRRVLARVLVVLAVLGLVGGGTGWWYAAAGPGAYTTAPGLLKLSKAEAEATAAEQGFTVTYADPQFSETLGRGLVLSSDPEPGAHVREGSEITLVLSRGKERYEVPALEGAQEDRARALLDRNNLDVGEVTQAYSDTVPEGRVISSEPAAGKRLKRDTQVSLVVSRGVEPVEVPGVVGRSGDDARAALAERDFKVSVAEEFSETVPEGQVIRQDPADGMRPKGSTVEIVVSRGMPFVTVPDVVGKPVGEAEATLRALGLQVRVWNLPAGPDQVLDQSPDAGDKVRKGSRVSLSAF
jgi:beta-lactam-binding protein with PASTA domain/predicted Ser/Thr protein kinase